MTANYADADAGPAVAGPREGEPSSSSAAAPVIALTYPYSGARFLESALTTDGSVACTSGTGLLPLCEQALDTWQHVAGGHGTRLNPLGAASIRAMISAMTTSVLARTGARLWCEFATVPPGCAEAFLKVFPACRFLCLHRTCADFVYAGIKANPWGLSGRGLSQFVIAYPANSVAALAAYWVARTETLIALEEAHPGACLPVKYEDLVANRLAVGSRIYKFLGWPEPQLSHVANDGEPVDFTESEWPGCGKKAPMDSIPPALRAMVNGLLSRLDYQELT